jgi:hypothetical protein
MSPTRQPLQTTLPHHSLVDPELFISRMEKKWTEYGNVMSDPLRRVWGEICQAFNSQMSQPSLPRPVIPAELGAGKTTAAKQYCALMADVFPHPGILVVVRTIEQAKDYAQDINEWAGEETALAWWSKRSPKMPLDELSRYPVAIICHRSYEMSLDEKLVEEHERYDKITRFRGGVRRLAIIDEALEQVYIARLSLTALKEIRRLIPTTLAKKHTKASNLLGSVETALCEAPDGNAVISASKLLAKTHLTIEKADRIISEFWIALKDVIPSDRRLAVKEWFTALRRHLAAFRWTEADRRDTALVNSRLLLPPDSGQVFLDATGRLNSVYTGRPDQFQILQMPQVRDYQTVELRYALVKSTGKIAMAMEGSKIIARTLKAVMDHYGEQAKERRVLVVVSEEARENTEILWAYGGFKEVSVGHWNAIDGRNDWRYYDTVVIISLNWATRTLDLANYVAIHGLELNDEGLNNPPDGVRTAREQRISASIAQAIGRIRLRQMTREDGTCEPCDVFLRLPHSWAVNHLDSMNILNYLQTVMTGIRVIEWKPMTEKKTPAGARPRATNQLAETILELARMMKPGDRKELGKEDFGVPNGTFGRVLESFQDPENPRHAELAALGARIEKGRRGRGKDRGPALLRLPG